MCLARTIVAVGRLVYLGLECSIEGRVGWERECSVEAKKHAVVHATSPVFKAQLFEDLCP